MDKLPDLDALWQQTLSWQPDSVVKAKLQKLYELVIQGNRQFNLTRITAPRDFWEKHLWDSLAGVTHKLIDVSQPGKIIDIGSGAGFPGLPIAIAWPDWRITLLDSTRKKVMFLEELSSELDLHNVSTINCRAEALPQKLEQQSSYDLALIRAVGSAEVCAHYALPLVKPGGLAVLYRGNWSQAENEQLRESLARYKGKLLDTKGLTTPLSQSTRHYLYITKLAN